MDAQEGCSGTFPLPSGTIGQQVALGHLQFPFEIPKPAQQQGTLRASS